MEEGNPLSPLPLLRRIDSGCDLGNLIDGLWLSSLDGDGGFEESDQVCLYSDPLTFTGIRSMAWY